MARIRSIKPDIWRSPQVMNLSPLARLLFIGLITQADDDGRGHADLRSLKGEIFPGDDDITRARIETWLAECVTHRLVVTYDGGEHGPLYEILKWHEHQKIDKRRASRFPNANGADGSVPVDSTTPRRTVDEQSTKPRRAFDEASRMDWNGLEGNGISESSVTTSAHARARNAPDIKNKPGPEKRTRAHGKRNAPRAGPGLQPLAPILERFLVEQTPEWAKGPT